MVSYLDSDTILSDDEVDQIFRALADATRRDIMRRTLVDEASISDLAAHYEMTFAAVQKHITVLEGAGLVTKHRSGRERLIRGHPEAIRKARTLLNTYERIWQGRIEQLDALLTDD